MNLQVEITGLRLMQQRSLQTADRRHRIDARGIAQRQGPKKLTSHFLCVGLPPHPRKSMLCVAAAITLFCPSARAQRDDINIVTGARGE